MTFRLAEAVRVIGSPEPALQETGAAPNSTCRTQINFLFVLGDGGGRLRSTALKVAVYKKMEGRKELGFSHPVNRVGYVRANSNRNTHTHNNNNNNNNNNNKEEL